MGRKEFGEEPPYFRLRWLAPTSVTLGFRQGVPGVANRHHLAV